MMWFLLATARVALYTVLCRIPYLVVLFVTEKIPYVITRGVCPSVCLSVVCGNNFGHRLHYIYQADSFQIQPKYQGGGGVMHV